MVEFSKNIIYQAPLASVADSAFRKLCAEYGADVFFSEMVSVEGLIHNYSRTEPYLLHDKSENPFVIQLFSDNADNFVKAVEIILKKYTPFFIDINAGCPVKKVVKKGAGSALLLEPAKLQNIQYNLTKKFPDIVFTTKIRAGWDKNSINFIEIGKRSQDAGIKAIFFHPRLRSEFFAGHSNWDYIRELKKNIDIPVVGNGDIFSPDDAKRMLEFTQCDGIMIGRGMLGRPWIFAEIKNALYNGTYKYPATIYDKINVLKKHYLCTVQLYGELHGVKFMRKHFSWYTKGWYNVAKLRQKILTITEFAAIEEVLDKYLAELENNGVIYEN